MRRIIRGKTYDTDTATLAAVDRWEGDDGPCIDEVYRTSGGAFFVVEYRNRLRDEEWRSIEFEPMTREAADAWFANAVQVEILDENIFAIPDEAEAKDLIERAVTFTFRLPESQRDNVQRAAATEGLSMNAFLLRCSKTCLTIGDQRFQRLLSGINYLVGGMQLHDLDAFYTEQLNEMIEQIGQDNHEIMTKLYGKEEATSISGLIVEWEHNMPNEARTYMKWQPYQAEAEPSRRPAITKGDVE